MEPRSFLDDASVSQEALSTSQPSSRGSIEPSSAPQEHHGEKADVSSENLATETVQKGLRFWMIFISLCFAAFGANLNATILSTALPSIAKDIGGEQQYVWIVNSYTIAATACQPLFGQMANIFGRRGPMLFSAAAFAIGSGIAGGANGIAMLLAGRIIQGIGGGGIMMLIELIPSDLVPVRERGKYFSLILSVCSLGITIGPIIGGALVSSMNWRWALYINVIIAGLAFLFLVFFLKLQHKRSPTWMAALGKVDYIGNIIFIGSTCSLLIGLVLGGVQYSWSSWQTIVPIVVGVAGWGAFHLYEASSFCLDPTMPPRLFSNRTACAAFVLAFLSTMLLEWTTYFLPLYFQAQQGYSPLDAGLSVLPINIGMLPVAGLAGWLMSKFGQYKPCHWVGFAFLSIAYALFSTMDQGTSKLGWIVFELLAAIGFGSLIVSTVPPIQASLPESDVAAATSTHAFLRSLGLVWGVSIPSIVFDNRIDVDAWRIDDAATRAAIVNGGAYSGFSAAIPTDTQSQAYTQVMSVYTDSLHTVWRVGIAFGLLGVLLVFVEKHIEMRVTLETEYGMDRGEKSKDDPPAERQK